MSDITLATRSRTKKSKRRNQTPWGIGILILAIFITPLLPNRILAVSWIIGLLLGFTLERSRFCFVSAFTDPFIIRDTCLLRAIVLSLAVSTVGFGVLQYLALEESGVILGYVGPVGVHTVIGAILFGFGMVIAGGCSSGTLMRIGEGFVFYLLVLLGFAIGTLWGARDFKWWHDVFISRSPTVHLPQIFGWIPALLVQLSVLGIVYYGLLRYEKSGLSKGEN